MWTLCNEHLDNCNPLWQQISSKHRRHILHLFHYHSDNIEEQMLKYTFLANIFNQTTRLLSRLQKSWHYFSLCKSMLRRSFRIALYVLELLISSTLKNNSFWLNVLRLIYYPIRRRIMWQRQQLRILLNVSYYFVVNLLEWLCFRVLPLPCFN